MQRICWLQASPLFSLIREPLRRRAFDAQLRGSLTPILALAGLIVISSGAVAAAAEKPADYGFVQKFGSRLPVYATVVDAKRNAVPLGDLLGNRPAILVLGYFRCKSLCSLIRDDLFEALTHSGLSTPADYGLIVMSIDPAETRTDAATAMADDMMRYPLPGSETGWHFVTADAAAIAAVSEAVGFKSRYDEHLRQFIHPAGLVIVTSEGRVSNYVLGVGYHAGDLRTAVTLASKNAIAKAALPILLLCFHYDEVTGRYSFAILKVMRLAAVMTVLLIGGLLLVLHRRNLRRFKSLSGRIIASGEKTGCPIDQDRRS